MHAVGRNGPINEDAGFIPQLVTPTLTTENGPEDGNQRKTFDVEAPAPFAADAWHDLLTQMSEWQA
jgi:hypothetical protein